MPEMLEIEVKGKKIALKHVTRRIRGRVEDAARRWRKQQAADNLSFAGYDAESIADRLAAIDESPVDTNSEVCPYLRTAEGVEMAIVCHMADPDDADLVEDIENPGELLLKLWDGILVPAPIEEKAAEASPLPMAGATFGPTNPPPAGQST